MPLSFTALIHMTDSCVHAERGIPSFRHNASAADRMELKICYRNTCAAEACILNISLWSLSFRKPCKSEIARTEHRANRRRVFQRENSLYGRTQSQRKRCHRCSHGSSSLAIYRDEKAISRLPDKMLSNRSTRCKAVDKSLAKSPLAALGKRRGDVILQSYLP